MNYKAVLEEQIRELQKVQDVLVREITSDVKQSYGAGLIESTCEISNQIDLLIYRATQIEKD